MLPPKGPPVLTNSTKLSLCLRGANIPPINKYRCNKCGFALPEGWGGHMYVEDNKGKRIVCPHPGEMQTVKSVLGKMQTVKSVLGKNVSEKVFNERTGFNSYCICLDCLYQFEADLRDEKDNLWRFYYGNLYQHEKSNSQRFIYDTKEKDRRECPKCKSQNVKTVFELIGKICPKCKKGIIKEIETGWIC